MTTISMTEAEYQAQPACHRGTWTTERTDWPNWEEVRDRYMGKRTLMVNDKGAACLVVEGMGLEIVPNAPMRHMQCSCCGADAGRFQQWSNRDTGWGICRSCIDWIKGRGETAEEIHRLFGVEGVHYAAAEQGAAA